MAELRRDTLTVRREIESARGDLATNVARLRGVLRQRLSLRNQVRAHPRVTAAVVLVFSLPLFALAFVAGAVVRRRRRRPAVLAVQGLQGIRRRVLRA